MREAFAKGTGVVRGAVKLLARRPSRQRDHPSSGREPLMGPPGHHERELWKGWHPTYGVGYDELEAINKGQSGSRGA